MILELPNDIYEAIGT